MSENMENSTPNTQENSQKSENTQQNTELNIENNDTPSESKADAGLLGENHDNESENDGELPIPEPDIQPDEKKKKEPPEWLKKKLERDRKAAEYKAQEAERLREENERLKAGVAPQVPPVQPNMQPQQDPYMPRREQYADDASYFLALSDYRDHRREQEQVFHQRQAAIQEHEKKFHDNLSEAVESGKSKYKDFEERTDYILYGEGFPSNRGMAEAIVESSYKDDILYFLGTHVKEAERIARLNPVAAAKEIAKIEVRLDSRKKSNITKTPKPLEPLGGGSRGSATHKDPSKMDMDEFRQWYKERYG